MAATGYLLYTERSTKTSMMKLNNIAKPALLLNHIHAKSNWHLQESADFSFCLAAKTIYENEWHSARCNVLSVSLMKLDMEKYSLCF